MSITRIESYNMPCGCKVTREWKGDVLLSIKTESKPGGLHHNFPAQRQ